MTGLTTHLTGDGVWESQLWLQNKSTAGTVDASGCSRAWGDAMEFIVGKNSDREIMFSAALADHPEDLAGFRLPLFPCF